MSRFFGSRSRGTAVVEFALVVPIFALLLFGIVDAGRFVYTSNALNEAARAASRAGAVALPIEGCEGLGRAACVELIAKQRLFAVDISRVVVDVDCRRPDNSRDATPDGACVGGWRANDIVTVVITHRFPLMTPVFSQVASDPEMTGQATVTVQS